MLTICIVYLIDYICMIRRRISSFFVSAWTDYSSGLRSQNIAPGRRRGFASWSHVCPHRRTQYFGLDIYGRKRDQNEEAAEQRRRLIAEGRWKKNKQHRSSFLHRVAGSDWIGNTFTLRDWIGTSCKGRHAFWVWRNPFSPARNVQSRPALGNVSTWWKDRLL